MAVSKYGFYNNSYKDRFGKSVFRETPPTIVSQETVGKNGCVSQETAIFSTDVFITNITLAFLFHKTSKSMFHKKQAATILSCNSVELSLILSLRRVPYLGLEIPRKPGITIQCQ